MSFEQEITYQVVPGMIHRAKVIVKNPREKIQNRWANGIFYETQRHGMLNTVYKKFQGGTFIDIGAAIGNHSLFFYYCCGAERVFAFEPVQAIYQHLVENISLNHADRIRAWNLALGEKTGEVGMTLSTKPPEQGGMLMSRVDETGTGVDMARLDDILQAEGVEKVDCIKIDVENYNLPVLRGARETLARFHPAVFCECETTPQFEEVDRFLSGLGYQVWTVDGKPFVLNHTPTYLWEHSGAVDVTLVITTYNRPDSLRDLLNELIADAQKLTVHCRVYNDCSNVAYNRMPQGSVNFQIETINVQPHHGKHHYWKLIDRIFKDVKATRSRYYIQLPDDVHIRPGFFEQMIANYRAIEDPRKIALNLYTDGSRIGHACWTKTIPTIHRFGKLNVFRTGWMDMICLMERRFFEELDFTINPISLDRWKRNPRLSSGVGMQISQRLRRFSMYQVRECWLRNAQGVSLMNPDRPAREDLSIIQLDPIICGVASIPERSGVLKEAVESVLPFVDELHVYLNQYRNVPLFLKHPKIFVYRSQVSGDLGDAGKFYAVRQESAFYLAIDDDIFYPSDYVWRMVNQIRENQAAGYKLAVGIHGKIMHEQVQHFYHDHRRVFHATAKLDQRQPVHILGTGTVAFHTADLPISIDDFRGPPNMADIYFAIACQKHNVGCVVLPRPNNYLTALKTPTGKTIWARYHRQDQQQTELYNSWNEWRIRA